MRAVSLRLHAPPEGHPELRGLRLATPEQTPDERVVLWTGVPPSANLGRAEEHPVIAPVILDGELDGQRTYAERIPRGVWLAGADLPESLKPYVVARLLDGLSALHDVGRPHGGVQRGRVLLGADGEVVLVGRGRNPGREVLDLLALDGIASADDAPTLEPSDPGARARDLAIRCGSHDRALLAEWVAARLGDEDVLRQVVLLSGGSHDAVDEVVPDIGPELTDHGTGGILDRWSATGTSGTVTEVTSEVATTQHALAFTLWGRLSSGGRSEPPPDRFEAVDGTSSKAIRALLADEAPAALPLPLLTDPGTFVLHTPAHDDDMPTMIGEGITPRPPPVPAAPSRWLLPAQWLLAMALGGLIVWAVLTWSGR